MVIYLLLLLEFAGMALGSFESAKQQCPPVVEIFSSTHQEFGFKVRWSSVMTKTTVETSCFIYPTQVGTAMRFMIQDHFNRSNLLHKILVPVVKTPKGNKIFGNFVATAEKARAQYMRE